MKLIDLVGNLIHITSILIKDLDQYGDEFRVGKETTPTHIFNHPELTISQKEIVSIAATGIDSLRILIISK